MKIIKEFVRNPEYKTNIFAIRTNTYAGSIEHLNNLFNIVKKDFPDLKMSEARVVYYAGRSYARTYGIEFSFPEKVKIPEDYSERNQLEKYY
jgi:hypothetical protein